ncbi:MAG: hypothetical protein V1647_04700 [Pseudomonadota bacterium]
MFGKFFLNLKRSAMVNKFAPSETRYAAYEYFQDKATKAIKGKDDKALKDVIDIFLERLSIAADNSIKDAEEKEFIRKYIISLGNTAIEPTREFIRNKYAVAHPIEILIELIGKKETLDFLDTVLTTEDTLFDDPLVEKRIEILKQFAGYTHAIVLSKVFTFLNDSDDRLVIAAIRFIRDYVFSENEDFEKVRDAMINKFLEDETSMRIRIEILNVFVEQEWKAAGFKKRFEEMLPEGYYVNSQGYIKMLSA